MKLLSILLDASPACLPACLPIANCLLAFHRDVWLAFALSNCLEYQTNYNTPNTIQSFREISAFKKSYINESLIGLFHLQKHSRLLIFCFSPASDGEAYLTVHCLFTFYYCMRNHFPKKHATNKESKKKKEEY